MSESLMMLFIISVIALVLFGVPDFIYSDSQKKEVVEKFINDTFKIELLANKIEDFNITETTNGFGCHSIWDGNFYKKVRVDTFSTWNANKKCYKGIPDYTISVIKENNTYIVDSFALYTNLSKDEVLLKLRRDITRTINMAIEANERNKYANERQASWLN
jgi:hypothetical protein